MGFWFLTISTDELSQLYNKLNEHIKNYDKSELSDEFKNVQGIIQLQFKDYVYYTMDETSENANIYKYNKDTNDLNYLDGFNHNQMDITKNKELGDLLHKIPYKDEGKVLTNKKSIAIIIQMIIISYFFKNQKIF